jgi:hypothetical protein
MAGTAHKPRVAVGHSAGFAVADIRPLIAVMPLPKDDFTVPGTQVKASDLIKSIGGLVTIDVPAGEHRFDVHVALTDPAPVTALLAQCEVLGASLGAKLVNGACHLATPQIGGDMDVWVDGNELRVGKKSATGDGQAVELSPLGKELADGEWLFALYGRGTSLAGAQVPGVDPATPFLAPMLRGLSLISEVDMAARIDGDTVRFVLGARTLWANPDDVIAKVFAIPPTDTVTGKAQPAAKAVADGAASSPFAADLRAGEVGLMIPVAAVGVLAAVAIPAFVDYTHKAKVPEANLMLNRIGKNAKVVYITSSSFPVGDAPLTPVGPGCCAGPKYHCAVNDKDWQQATWQALDFQIDEPTLFQYSYHSDGKTFTAQAVGDLDCDGTFITYTLTGTVDSTGNPSVSLSEPPADAD